MFGCCCWSRSLQWFSFSRTDLNARSPSARWDCGVLPPPDSDHFLLIITVDDAMSGSCYFLISSAARSENALRLSVLVSVCLLRGRSNSRAARGFWWSQSLWWRMICWWLRPRLLSDEDISALGCWAFVSVLRLEVFMRTRAAVWTTHSFPALVFIRVTRTVMAWGSEWKRERTRETVLVTMI